MKRRLLVANLVVVIAVLIVLEVPLGLIYGRHEHDALNAELQRDAASFAALANEVVEHPGDHDVAAFAQRFATEPAEIVAIVDRSGNELTQPSVLSTAPGFAAVLDAAREGQAGSGEFDGTVYVAVPLGAIGEPLGAVVVARPDESIDARVRKFWLLLAALGAGVLGLSLLITSRVSSWVVDPLRRLDAKAAELGRGELTARADTDNGPPEVVTLAVTFNEMADRLHELVTSQRRFVADASHQLRTPLTALRLRVESLDPDNPAAIATIRDAALDEAARLTRLVDGLLSLARAEGRRPEREPVDVTAVLADRQEAWAPLAAEQQIELRVDGDPCARLIAQLVPGHLEQILDNLVDNALEASDPRTAVVLRALRVATTVEVHVIDEGHGMSETDRRRAFDPFWQGADGHSTGSTGLGLAIAEQLARACRGSITLQRAASGGIDAVARFPVNRDDP
jgi:signal transduction histidine kinase